MAERRILAYLEIKGHALSCDAGCMYLALGEQGAKCRLFTGSLDPGPCGPMRADECHAAEARSTLVEQCVAKLGEVKGG